MANTWNESGTTWSQGNWGEQNNYTLTLTGLSMTGSVGAPYAFAEQGWGRDDWGSEPWGESWDPVISLTGLSLTTALGTLAYAQATDGWGRDAWGDNNWGDNATNVSLTGVSATASLPDVSWGKQTWGEDGYGGAFYLNPADVMGLTGVAATAAIGSPVARGDYTESLTGQAMASAVGAIIIGEGIPLTGVSGTIAVGTPVARGDYTESLTGFSSLQTALGTINVTSNPTVQPTGLSATAAVGAISPTEQTMGLTGVAATAAVGAITPTEQTMGLTGVSATVTVSPIGVAPIGWGRVTAAQSGNWTRTTK